VHIEHRVLQMTMKISLHCVTGRFCLGDRGRVDTSNHCMADWTIHHA